MLVFRGLGGLNLDNFTDKTAEILSFVLLESCIYHRLAHFKTQDQFCDLILP